MQKIIGLYLLVILTVAGCAGIPTLAMKNNMGAVGINIDVRLKGDLLNWFPGFVEPSEIYFARLDGSGKVHNQKEVIKSNYFIGDSAYKGVGMGSGQANCFKRKAFALQKGLFYSL